MAERVRKPEPVALPAPSPRAPASEGLERFRRVERRLQPVKIPGRPAALGPSMGTVLQEQAKAVRFTPQQIGLVHLARAVTGRTAFTQPVGKRLEVPAVEGGLAAQGKPQTAAEAFRILWVGHLRNNYGVSDLRELPRSLWPQVAQTFRESIQKREAALGKRKGGLPGPFKKLESVPVLGALLKRQREAAAEPPAGSELVKKGLVELARTVGRGLEAEVREIGRPTTGAVAAWVQIPVDLLRGKIPSRETRVAAGIESLIPGRQPSIEEISEAREARVEKLPGPALLIGENTLVPSNLLPVPVLDDLARVGWKAGGKVTAKMWRRLKPASRDVLTRIGRAARLPAGLPAGRQGRQGLPVPTRPATPAALGEPGEAEAEAVLRTLGIRVPQGAEQVTVAGRERELAEAKKAVEKARLALKETQRRFTAQAKLRAQFERGQAVLPGFRRKLPKLVSEDDIVRAQKRLSEARNLRDAAKKRLTTAKIEASTEDFLFRARKAGADEEALGTLRAAYEGEVKSLPSEESLLTASAWRQRLARIRASIEGTVPGVVGHIADITFRVQDALRRATAEKLSTLTRELDKTIAEELPNLRYVGPTEIGGRDIRPIVEAYKPYVLVQHPNWFKGIPRHLSTLLREVQSYQRSKLRIAQELGYPIRELAGPYLEQMWDIAQSELQAISQRPLAGKVSVARGRVFGDYIEAILAGYTPRGLSVGELVEHSSALMDKAISDAYMRRLVLERFGRRFPGRATEGYRAFGPGLYSGWYAPGPIVNFVEQLQTRTPGFLVGLRSVADSVKNSVFGADFGVMGVQVLLGVVTRGHAAVTGMVNRFLERAGLPFLHVYLDDGLARATRQALDGLHLGMGPSAVTPKQGTILKYIPVIGEHVDKAVSTAIDELARIQFGAILTPIRQMMYEGNLVALHLTGQDITDPAVRRIAADFANAATGASRGAKLAGRRAAESVSLVSFQMKRAQLALLGQVAKGMLSPKASSAERILAAMTLANFGVVVYGLGSAINMAFGNGPVEFDPRKGDWASIKVAGLNVPIVPQRTLVRAIAKSFDRIAREKPEDVALVWTQFVGSALSPLARIPVGAAGFGWDPDVGYQAGTLTGKGRILNIAPLPVIVGQALTEPGEMTPPSIGVQLFGFNVWEQSPWEQMDRLFRAETGKSLQDAEKQEIEAFKKEHPELAQKLEREQQARAKKGDVRAEFFVELDRINDDYNTRVARAADAIRSDEEFRKVVRDLEAQRRGAVDAIRSNPRYAEVVEEQERKSQEILTRKLPRGSRDQKYLLAVYGQVFDAHRGETPNEQTAPGGLFEALDAFWADLTPTEVARLERGLGLKLPPRAQQMRRDLKRLRPYWEAADIAWRTIQENYPEARAFRSADEYRLAVEERLRARGMAVIVSPDDDPILSLYNLLLRGLRERMRVQEPEIDLLLARYYGYRPRTLKALRELQEELVGR